MRVLSVMSLACAVLLGVGPTLRADDAEDSLRRSRAYGEIHRIALREWERIYAFALRDLKGLSGERYETAKRDIVPAFVFFGGRNAFHQGRHKVARARLALAERLAADSADKAIARQAHLWGLACDVALNIPDALGRLKKESVETESADELFLFAYLLDRLGAELDGARKKFYVDARRLAEKQRLSREALLQRGWLAFRIEKQPSAYLSALARFGEAPDAPAPAAAPAVKTGARRYGARRITSIDLYDAARLEELSRVHARRAYELAPPRGEARVRAALRLGLYDEARRLAHAAARKPRGEEPMEKLKTYTWRILKAAGDEGAGRKGALLQLRKRIVNPGFAAEHKLIYYAIGRALSEVLLDAGLKEEALQVAESAVASLEKNYRSQLGSGQLLDYYEQARPIYGTLAFACDINGKTSRSFEVYGLVYPWHRSAWLKALKTTPLFCVRYTALLFKRNDFALARELVYNFKEYGLLDRYPHARQIHSASAALEYLYRK